MRYLRVFNNSGHVNRLMILVESLNGRWPNRAMCKENGIDIVYLDRKFGDRRELKEFVRDMRSAIYRKEHEIEKEARDSRES